MASNKLRSADFRRAASRLDRGVAKRYACSRKHTSCRCEYGTAGRLAQDAKREPIVLADDVFLAFEEVDDLTQIEREALELAAAEEARLAWEEEARREYQEWLDDCEMRYLDREIAREVEPKENPDTWA